MSNDLRRIRQCERAVQKLGIKKTAKDIQWKYIGHEIAKRQSLGKRSVVLVHDQKIEEEVTRRETRRHFETTLERLKRSMLPNSTLPYTTRILRLG